MRMHASVITRKPYAMPFPSLNKDDIIIFAGKGHEDFQIIGNEKYPHSDADIALKEAEEKFKTEVTEN